MLINVQQDIAGARHESLMNGVVPDEKGLVVFFDNEKRCSRKFLFDFAVPFGFFISDITIQYSSQRNIIYDSELSIARVC